MKTKSPTTANPVAQAFTEKLTAKQASGTRYALRTECRLDCHLIRAVLYPWLSSWKETSGYKHDDSYITEDGVIWASQNWAADTEVQFIVTPDGPCLNEIRWLMMTLTDCHVATQSLETMEQYTGKRIDYDVLESSAERPLKKVIVDSIKGLRLLHDLNRNTNSQLEESIEMLESV